MTQQNLTPRWSSRTLMVVSRNKSQVCSLNVWRRMDISASLLMQYYQGASGGYPRNVDIPANRMEDIRRASTDILLQYPGVDSGRVGILGICGGGGYTVKTAQTDKRFKVP